MNWNAHQESIYPMQTLRAELILPNPTKIECASQSTTSISLWLILWSKQISKLNLEQTDFSRTYLEESIAAIRNNVQKRKKDLNNTKMHWPFTMPSSSEALFFSFHANYDTWFWQQCMKHILERMQLSISQNVAWWPGITQDVQHFVSNCKNCQMNRPSIWERLLRDWVMLRTNAMC